MRSTDVWEEDEGLALYKPPGRMSMTSDAALSNGTCCSEPWGTNN